MRRPNPVRTAEGSAAGHPLDLGPLFIRNGHDREARDPDQWEVAEGFIRLDLGKGDRTFQLLDRRDVSVLHFREIQSRFRCYGPLIQ